MVQLFTLRFELLRVLQVKKCPIVIASETECSVEPTDVGLEALIAAIKFSE
jgi:hypothetical protein